MAAIAVGAEVGGACAAPATPAAPDLAFLREEPLVDAERLRRFMAIEGLDALVVSRPANVFYLSNHWPQLDRMGLEGAGVAVFSRDPRRPLALVMHAFLYYYTHTPESAFKDGRLVFTYTQPAGEAAPSGGPPQAAPARTMRVIDEARLTPLDRHRTEQFARARAPQADASWALQSALSELGLLQAVVGVDTAETEAALRRRGFSGEIRFAEDTIRRARLAKSPAELRLMRMAAQNNVDAALAAARQARALGSSRALRARFFAEAAERGNMGSFMVIGGASTETIDQPFQDGSSVSIDCVSTLRFYHGDFGRTIFIGDPPRAVQRAAAGVAQAWHDIREQLRPGMRFADIPRIGRESLSRQGLDLTVSFTPHGVGLFHTDHPQASLLASRAPDALALEEGMVLSVDCPVFLAGLGGTIHLEDLMLIRNGRAEPMHSIAESVLVV